MTRSAFGWLLFLFVLLGVPSPGESRLDPRLNWSTLETPHFLVLYHEGGEEVAGRAAIIAEEAHQHLAAELRWEPGEKTRLVLADVSDAANGLATPFPFNRIIVYLTPPLEEPFSITDTEEWLRIVITHEYAHILHLDHVQQGPAFLRRIFGRLYFPNVFQPNWLIEGLATYEETALSQGGRGRSSYTEMLLRTAVLTGTFPDLSQGAAAPDSWPGGELPYLYGVKFYQYLVDKYGPTLPGELSQRYAGRSLPFMVDSTARAAFGSTFKTEWLLWQQQLQREYAEKARELTALGLTEITPLSSDGGYTFFPAPSPAGDRIAYSSRTADRSFSLMLATADGQEPRPLLRRSVTPANAAIAWMPDGSGLIYAKLERDRYDNLYSDLYLFDFVLGEELRLTHGLRTGSPDVSPLNGDILCTVGHTNGNRLAVVNIDGSIVRYLSPEGDPRLFATPRWAPDGQRLAVAVKDADGRFLIQILDPDGTLRATLPDNGGINASPAWSHDGTTLFFTSDRNGIYNLYAYRLATTELLQVTNLLGGAFSPQPSPDGESLLFVSYSAAGFDLARMPLHPDAWTVLPVVPSLPTVAPEPQPPSTLENTARPYSPWSDLLPRYWLPWFGVDELGAQLGLSTSGNDAVDRHSWAATATYGLKTHRPAYSLLYRYDGFTPTVQFLATDQAIPYADFFVYPSGAEESYWERRRSFGLDLIFPGAGLWARQELSAGLRYQDFAAADDPPPGFLPPEEGQLASLRFAYSFANSVRPPKAISPEEGRSLTVAAQLSSAALGGDFDQRKYTLDWHEYTVLPWGTHQVLATRIFGGLAQGDLLAQRAFQVGGDSSGDLLQGLDEEKLALRGYAINAFRGQRAILASTEYRFPLLNLEQGIGNGPLYFRRLHGAVFAEGADAFDRGGVMIKDFRTAAGAELRCDLDLGYRLPLTLRLVVAKGFDQGGEDQGYLTLWLRF
ncbi:MAG: BamA/TamA family outer membrane protein [Desulfuromonadales bacterium]|nr:BamA/TamA family outer membrane protein [Desulfuromonadales bacterium]